MAQKEGQPVKRERWWLKGEARWLDRRRSVLCVWKGKVSNHKVAGWHPHNGSYGRLDLTPMPLAKVIAFSSGLYNTLQSAVQTNIYLLNHTQLNIHMHSHPFTDIWTIFTSYRSMGRTENVWDKTAIILIPSFDRALLCIGLSGLFFSFFPLSLEAIREKVKTDPLNGPLWEQNLNVANS